MIEDIVKSLISNYLDSQKGPLATRLRQAIIDWLNPVEPEPVPVITGWQPPTVSGEVCRLPGQFFMSGLRGSYKGKNGLFLGTYRPAKLYFWDGATFELIFSLPCESFYMLHMTPDGRPLVSTEYPAQLFKLQLDNTWLLVCNRSGNPSLGFDVWPYKDGLLWFTVNQAHGDQITIYRGNATGDNWQHHRNHEGHFLQDCTDGQTYWLVGEKNGLPYIVHENGSQVLLDEAYQGQIINYASVRNGLFTLGMNNIADIIAHDGKRRNGYVNYFDGKNDIAGIDCRPPFIMQTDIDLATGRRYAIASIWNETGYPAPELVISIDGRNPWKKIADIPFPSVQTVEIADGGVWSYGGQKDQFGAVHFNKS